MDGDDQLDLTNMSLCVDPEYDLLWGCGESQVSCYNPLAVGLKGKNTHSLSLHFASFFMYQIQLVTLF